jgi:acyl carrier protein
LRIPAYGFYYHASVVPKHAIYNHAQEVTFLMQEIAQKIRSFVVNNFLFQEEDGRFSNDDSFLETGAVDSVGILTLVEFVEEQYTISIEDEEIVPDNWDSVHRIAAFVQTKLGSRA